MPNKQEEIREGIERELLKAYGTTAHRGKVSSQEMFTARQLLKYLHSQGVVIKVKCPKCGGHARPNKVTYNLHEGYRVNGHSCPNCNNTGYVAVKPLIEEIKQ